MASRARTSSGVIADSLHGSRSAPAGGSPWAAVRLPVNRLRSTPERLLHAATAATLWLVTFSAPSVVRGPAVVTPGRRAGSVRRTSTIDMRWPGGRGTQLRLLGRARDLWTPADGRAPEVLAEDVVHVGAAPDRTIEDIWSEPARPELRDLVGTRGGGRLRGRLAEVVPREIAAGTPLALLLDDLSGATLIAGFAYRQWADEWMTAGDGSRAPRRRMEGICAGFRPGSSALDEHGSGRDIHDIKPVHPVTDPDDPAGWHTLEEITEVSMRRARRIDVWL